VPTNRIITKGILVFIDCPDLMQYHFCRQQQLLARNRQMTRVTEAETFTYCISSIGGIA
jgi:hypothetical protein